MRSLSIIIRNAKNDRDRILPLSDSLTDICLLYKEKCLSKNLIEKYFFSQYNGERYASDTISLYVRIVVVGHKICV